MSTSPKSKEDLLADLRRQVNTNAYLSRFPVAAPPSRPKNVPDSDGVFPPKQQLDDSASDASSVDSRGRRRRRNKALQKSGGLSQPAVLPRLADTKPVRLQLGLNLDVEVELKARLQGDVSLTLL